MAFRLDTKGPILADERPERINLPTFHVVGARDPARLASMSLYNLCNPRSATLYDHGKGHTIPWASSPTVEIARGVRDLLQRATSLVPLAFTLQRDPLI
ncbi:MAG: hypothetical protein Q9211_001816 [Gyalolechia sp. 1 TL-2023]